MKNIEESTYFHEKYEKLQKVCIVCDFVKIIILGILMVFYGFLREDSAIQLLR